MIKRIFAIIFAACLMAQTTQAQNNAAARDTAHYLTLDQCVAYALQHQPTLKQSSIGISIARATNNINQSGWLPQVSLNATYTHYFQLPSTVESDTANPSGPPVRVLTGISNTAIPQLNATQTIFSPDVLYAVKSAHLFLQEAEQANDSTKIGVITNVSKSFYSLLLTLEQITVLKEDTVLIGKNLRDAYHQYVGGIVDKTDYKEATITLNTTKAQLKQAMENITPQYAVLKQQMGYPPEQNFNVSFDTAKMTDEIALDTTQQLQYEKRIEVQQLQTAKNLQEQSTDFYRYSFLPTMSIYYDYNYEFESNNANTLFQHAYPYSFIGASFSLPLFTGFRRTESLQRAKLQGQLLDWGLVNLKSVIYTQYTMALASYKGNLYDLNAMHDNTVMAKDVFNIVTLQYREGIVPYLNVITAESNLINSEISYYNALFQVLSSKIDVEKAMGNIK